MKYLMIYFVLLLTLASCKKEETQPELPPETTTGENTAGFIVDGKKIIVPYNSSSSVPGSGTSYGISYKVGYDFDSLEKDYIQIKIGNFGQNTVYSIYVRVNKLENVPRKYILGDSNGEYGTDGPDHPQIILIVGSKNKETQWYYSKSNSGFIDITRADFRQQTFSGIFECTLYNRFNEEETIQITKGRFDINLITINK